MLSDLRQQKTLTEFSRRDKNNPDKVMLSRLKFHFWCRRGLSISMPPKKHIYVNYLTNLEIYYRSIYKIHSL